MLKFRRLPAMAFICLVICGVSWLSPGSQAPAGEKGTYGSYGTIFVKGHYAYVADYSDTTYTDALLHVYDIEDPNSISLCTTICLEMAEGNLRQAETFVAGDYLYLAAYGQHGAGLWKYDISGGNECSPRFVDSTWSYVTSLIITDMYVNDGKAYVSIDASPVAVFNVPDSTVSCEYGAACEYWVGAGCSPHGVHVRGGTAYIAGEAIDLWVRYIGDEDNEYADVSSASSRDVYNIGYTDSNLSMTYQIGTDSLRVWGDSTDVSGNHYIFYIGACGVGGPDYGVVHVNGEYVYALTTNGAWLGSVEYGAPQVVDSWSGISGLKDIHTVHECDTLGNASAHVFGLCYIDTLTPPWEIWIPDDVDHSISAYKYGDVDDDGDVDLSDALKINYYTVRGYNAVIDNLDAADVDCDGEVNSYDSVYLLAYLYTGGPAPGAGCSFYEDW